MSMYITFACVILYSNFYDIGGNERNYGRQILQTTNKTSETAVIKTDYRAIF